MTTREEVERGLKDKLVHGVCIHFLSQLDMLTPDGKDCHFNIPGLKFDFGNYRDLTKEGRRLEGATFEALREDSKLYDSLIYSILVTEEKYNIAIPI